MTQAVTNYLERAVTALGSVGIHINGKVETAPVLRLMESIKHYDEGKVVAMAATLQQASSFHRTVREQTRGLDVSPIYQTITNDFDSIREDSAKLAEWVADGKLDLMERMKMMFMKVVRGSVPDRFAAIERNFLTATAKVNEEIERETVIRSAYQDYQMSVLQVKVMAEQVLVIATGVLEEKRAALEAANSALDTARAGNDEVKTAELELLAQEALRAYQHEDKCYQIAKDIAEDQKTGHSTSKVVMAHLEQVAVTKERLHSRMVSFFSAQEGVITALSAAYTASNGLAAATNVLKAQKRGTEAAIESLAKTGNIQVREAIEMGYGPSLDANPVKLLNEAVVKLQSDMKGLIADSRDKATTAANEVEQATNEGERAFAALVAKAG